VARGTFGLHQGDVVKLLVTGGCGFIGSCFVHLALERGAGVVNLDKLTYAGNPANVADVADDPGYRFVHADIADAEAVAGAIDGCEVVVNFAAESHVDRSILDPAEFIQTDVVGTAVLLAAAREAGVRRFVQVSTDEVYGSIAQGAFRETDPISPSSPYSASKAGGDLQVLAWHNTFGLDAVITRGSNTYGPRQYPEKLIPLFVTNALDGEPLPVYGDGLQIRDWLHVEDHCTGIWTAMEKGVPGEVYNVGGGDEETNLEITRRILELTGCDPDLVRHVTDRPGHDRRYALDTTKSQALGWKPEHDFADGLAETVAWYKDRRDWWEPIKSGAYRTYYETQYGAR
jgi:dTDP-glucose 4,6-dehydratase